MKKQRDDRQQLQIPINLYLIGFKIKKKFNSEPRVNIKHAINQENENATLKRSKGNYDKRVEFLIECRAM